jgi:hypothetical protein
MLNNSIRVLKNDFKLILGGCYNTEPSKSKGNGTSSWYSKEASPIISASFIHEWMQTENFRLWNESLLLS